MIKTISKLVLAAVAVMLLGSCNEIYERIDKLESRINGIENETIKDIAGQISSINSSITDLGSIRNSIQSLTSTVGTQGGDITSLQSADEALGGRIDELNNFVNGELVNYAKTEWVEATFLTLAEYEKTCDTIAMIDVKIGNLDTRLSGEIAAAADSLKGWINVQFGSYYTAAQMDAKLEALQAEIDSTDAENKAKADSIAAELTEAKAAVDSAKANIRAEYRTAIDTAITALDGKLSKALQDSIAAVNFSLDHLAGWVKAIDNAVVALTGRVKALEDMIQSVTIIPAYSDGSVEAKSGLLYLDIVVKPATAVAGLTKDSLTILVNKVKTKAVNVEEVAVADLKVDEVNGIIKARANIASKLPETSGDALTVAVNVKNGISDYTSNFYPVEISEVSNVTVTAASQSTESTKITIVADPDFPKSVMGNIAVADGFDGTHSTAIEMAGIGTITFNETASSQIRTNAQNEGSTSVFFKVEEVTESKPVAEANLVYEVTMKTVDESGVEVFSEGKADGVATVTVPLGDEVSTVTSVTLVSENGTIIEGGVVPGSIHFENGILSFKVNHFSRYAIKYTLKEKVAQIGNTKFWTLEDAIAAAQDGNTIQMIADFATTDNVTVSADKNIVLDLNGKKISYTTNGYGSFIENKGQLKIIDSGQNGIITAKFSAPDWNNGCYTINNAGTYDKAGKLVIESGTIENTSPAGLAWPISNGVWGTQADLVINGGTIHSTNYVPVREYLQYGGKKTIVINGGKFISDNSRAIAVQVNDATIADTGSSVTINGGEFICNGSGILYIDLHAANADLTGFTMTVNGGQFKNADADAPVLVYDYEGRDQTSAVLLSMILKGGIYSKEPAQELISFEYHKEANTDSQTSSAYPWRVVANSAEGAEVSISKPGQTTVYSTLAAFRDATNAGNTFAGYTVTLLKDIAYSSSNYWTPIGYMYGTEFAGTFDGGGHKVEGLNIDTEQLGSTPDYWPGGFFGYTRGAKIKNLSIYGKTDCAGMVGYAEYTDISDCESHMDSELCYNISGGFIAHADAYVTLSNCKNYGNFICKTSANYAEVGGIVGRFYGGDHCSVTNCENYGNISWEGESGGAQRSLGGIVAGFYNATAISSPQKCVISGCKNYGTIYNKNATSGTTTSTTGGIGGIVGKPFLQGNGIGVTISNCTNSGDVVSFGRAGGIVGTLNEAWQNVGKYSTVSGCTNTGSIYGTDGSRGQIYGIMSTNSSDPDKDNVLSNNQENGTLKAYDEYTN